MERLAIWCDGAEAGELTVTPEQLYVRFDAVCPLREGVWRLWAVGRAGEAALGVPEPVSGKLRLCRRLSRQALSPAGALLRGELRAADAPREDGWQALTAPEAFFRGSLRGLLRGAEGALWRQEGELRLLALPFDPQRPFPLTALFCFARLGRIRGRTYAVFAFDGQEWPVMR